VEDYFRLVLPLPSRGSANILEVFRVDALVRKLLKVRFFGRPCCTSNFVAAGIVFLSRKVTLLHNEMPPPKLLLRYVTLMAFN